LGYPTPGQPNTYQPKAGGGFNVFSTGGCVGCHGVAQTQGGDFSFLIAKGTGNATSPDPLVAYPGGPILPQNATGIKDGAGNVIVFPITKQPSTGGPPAN
jgi:hypothetical protein